MSLGRKIVVLFIMLGVSFSVGSYVVLKHTVLPAFQAMEREATEAALLRVDRALRSDLHDLGDTGKSYVRLKHANALDSERKPDVLSDDSDFTNWYGSNVDMLAVFDRPGRRLHIEFKDAETFKPLSIEEVFYQPLGPGHPLVSRSSGSETVAGILQTRNGIMQVASSAIFTENSPGLVAGTVVVGRFLNSERIASIANRTMTTISLQSDFDKRSVKTGSNSVLNSNFGALSTVGDMSGFGYYSLKDLYGNTVASLTVSAPGNLPDVGSKLTQSISQLMFVLCAVFFMISSLLMRRLIVLPVNQLTNHILDIRKTGDLGHRIHAKRNDEIGVLSGEFCAMTSELAEGQVRLEQARDEALALSDAKSDFLARMSHEIRTPMNGVLGMTELLRNTRLLPKQARYASTIYDSAHSLLRVINDILDFSKIEAGKVQLESVDVHLGAIVDETVQSFAGYAHAQRIELMTDVPHELNRLVKTDPVRLRQVLNNLIGNAIKFTPEGEVVVRLYQSDVEPDAGFRTVCFEVSDTGIGIAPEHQNEIFESFVQADGSTTRLYGGSGLGLAICKQIIEQLGGELSVSSVPDRGSVFSFSLTLLASHNTASDAAVQMQCVAGRRVLIVDDNSTNRDILQNLLKGWRAQADSIESGAVAYNRLVAAHESGAPYELAILDVHTSGITGLDLARKIRANPKFARLKIVMLSSIGATVSPKVLEELNIGAQLSRPVSQSQLYNSVAKSMGETVIGQKGLPENESSARQLRGRILVVEDNEVNRLVATAMLESLGLEVVLATNGLEALESFASDSFDLILMDCQLPVMNGLKATENIRLQETATAQPRTPIIAATANALEDDRQACLVSGMDDCLIKPYTSEQLHSVLALYLPVPETTINSNVIRGARFFSQNEHIENSTSVIDGATLCRLSKLQQPGAPNIMRKLLSLYLQSSVVIKDKLIDAIDCADALAVRETAHALKSSSLNVGAKELAEVCKQLEGMGRNRSIEDPPAMKRMLHTEYGKVVSAVNVELQSMTA